MKASTALSLIALVTSFAAGFFSINTRRELSETEITALVDSRLAAREFRFVQGYAPKFREMFAATDDSEFGSDWNPKTLEELLAPLVKMTSGMNAAGK